MESYITDSQLVEGLFASSVWAIFFVYLRKQIKYSVIKEGALAWLSMWLVRKFGLTLYLSLKKEYDWPSFKIKLLPMPTMEIDREKYNKMKMSEKIKILLIVFCWIFLIWSVDNFIFGNK
tara:strand:- start:83 stop:442 length:360 start_codon:yes stop_codon:yes gene_type:complete